MSVNSSDPFDLPEDRDLAFLQIEHGLRERLNHRLDTGEENSPWFEWYQDYANTVLAAAQGLDIDGFDHLAVPSNRNNFHDEHRRIILAVDRLAIQVRIDHARRNKRYSVALDGAAKAKIRHHLAQLKGLTNKLEVPQRKREAIINKIIALEHELERERTRFEIVGALIVDAASIAGDVGEKLEPWRKWVDSIARVVGFAKDEEVSNPALPGPREQRKIEPPKQLVSSPIDN